MTTDLSQATRVRNSVTGTVRIRRPGTDLWDAPAYPDAEPVTTAMLESLFEMRAEDDIAREPR